VRDCSERIQRDRRRLTRQAVRRTLSETATLAEAAPGLLETTCENLEWDLGVLWTVDRQTRQFQWIHSWHSLQGQDTQPEMFKRAKAASSGIALAGRVLEGGQAVWIPDCAEEFDLAEE